MRTALVLAAVVGCSDPGALPKPDALIIIPDVVVPFPFDVVVTPTTVEVYPNGGDQSSTGDCTTWAFPSAGTCAFDTDALKSCGTCFSDVRLVSAGATVVTGTRTADKWSLPYAIAPGAELRLMMAGCSIDPVDLALTGHDFPPATVTATHDTAALTTTVTWSTASRSTNALVDLGYGIFGDECLVTNAQQYVVSTALEGNDAPPQYIGVTAFSQPDTIATPTGPATLWWGGVESSAPPAQ